MAARRRVRVKGPPLRAAFAGLLLALAWHTAHADDPALWVISGRVNTVYLFGSVHLLRPGEYGFGGPLAEAYEDAEAIYLEVDPKELPPLAMAAATASRAVDPAGRTLFELLGPDEGLARGQAGRLGVDLTPVGQFEPWFAGLALVSLALAEHGYVAEAGVEGLVQSRAAEDGKDTLGFETLDEQLALLDDLDPVAQRAFLLKALAEIERVQHDVVRLVDAWRRGDIETLARELEAEFSAAPDLYDALILRRNLRWAERIEALLDDHRDYLVIVGALHLVGPDGLPRLLDARGARITRR